MLRILDDGTVRRGDGARFEPWSWSWQPAAPAVGGSAVSPREALVRLAAAGGLRPVPVGVIGPRAASPRQVELAAALGRALAGMGLPVLCGGKNGVMEAVALGVREAGGLCIGLLPEDDWRAANDHVLPIATGIGKSRNVLIAQASRALVAVGGELGTLTEIAFGLHFGKPVWGLDAAPEVTGLRRAADVDGLCEELAAELLGPSAVMKVTS